MCSEPSFGASVSGSPPTSGAGSPSRPRLWAARRWPILRPLPHPLRFCVGTAVLFFTLNREDFSFVIHLDRQPRTSRRREAQTGSRARSGSRSERTLDAVEHSRTLMEWWPFLIFHRGGLRIKVINNTLPHRSQVRLPVTVDGQSRRPDFDRNEDPTRCLLVARERANLVGLKLFGSEASDPSVVESTTHLGCLLEPAGDGVPGNPFDREITEMLTPSTLRAMTTSKVALRCCETVVGRAFRRGERLSALAAPVSTAFLGPGSVESVANDVSGTDFAPQRTCEIETSAILHFGSALTMRELCLRNSGSNSSTQTG